MLRAELGQFLIEVAMACMKLLQQCGRKGAGIGLHMRVRSQDQFRITLGGCAVFGFAQDSVCRRSYLLPAQFVDLQQYGCMLALALLAVGQHLRRAHNPMLLLECTQPQFILIPTVFQLFELSPVPSPKPPLWLADGFHSPAARRHESAH